VVGGAALTEAPAPRRGAGADGGRRAARARRSAVARLGAFAPAPPRRSTRP
jgi:hypothetical protein